jgi:hypothetical protein
LGYRRSSRALIQAQRLKPGIIRDLNAGLKPCPSRLVDSLRLWTNYFRSLLTSFLRPFGAGFSPDVTHGSRRGLYILSPLRGLELAINRLFRATTECDRLPTQAKGGLEWGTSRVFCMHGENSLPLHGELGRLGVLRLGHSPSLRMVLRGRRDALRAKRKRYRARWRASSLTCAARVPASPSERRARRYRSRATG